MTTELFSLVLDRIFESTDQYQYLTFAGMGEPFLDKEILDKIRIAREKGLQVLMLTNGSHLDRSLFNEIESLGVESIRVSFYGITPRSYQAVHGLSDVDKFKELMGTLTDLCGMPRKTKLIFTLNIVEGANDSEVKEWVGYWEHRADLIEVWRPHNWVYGRQLREVSNDKRETCGRPFTGPLQVQVDGTVNMCCFDFNGDLTLGDLRKKSLTSIFSNSLFEKICIAHKNGSYGGTGLICENCDMRNKDKSEVMAYNSKFDINERVECISTTYRRLN